MFLLHNHFPHWAHVASSWVSSRLWIEADKRAKLRADRVSLAGMVLVCFGIRNRSKWWFIMIYQQVAVQSIGRYGRYGRWARRSDRSGATDICSLEVCRNAIEGTGQSLWPKAQEMMEMSLRLMGLGTECSGCVGLSFKKIHIQEHVAPNVFKPEKISQVARTMEGLHIFRCTKNLIWTWNFRASQRPAASCSTHQSSVDELNIACAANTMAGLECVQARFQNGFIFNLQRF